MLTKSLEVITRIMEICYSSDKEEFVIYDQTDDGVAGRTVNREQYLESIMKASVADIRRAVDKYGGDQ